MTYDIEKKKGGNLLDYTAHFRIYGSLIQGYIFKGTSGHCGQEIMY